MWIHSVNTGLVSGDHITEASDALSEESQHVPILLRWKLRYREGNGARRPHSLSVTELADNPNWWPLKGSRGSPGVGMRWKKAGKSKNSVQKAQAISGSTGNKCWGSARCGESEVSPQTTHSVPHSLSGFISHLHPSLSAPATPQCLSTLSTLYGLKPFAYAVTSV